MSLSKAELVIHPVRLRILQTLLLEQQTTQDLSSRLPDVPTSSLYRHLRILLEAGFITVAETRLVQGIQEKTYALVEAPRLSHSDMSDVSAEEHLRYLTVYLVTLLQSFSDYLFKTSQPNFEVDYAGFTELVFWAESDELQTFSTALNEALRPLLQNEAGGDRRQHKLAVITHPIND